MVGKVTVELASRSPCITASDIERGRQSGGDGKIGLITAKNVGGYGKNGDVNGTNAGGKGESHDFWGRQNCNPSWASITYVRH